VEERRNLGYYIVTIQKPDLTGLADENLLRFGLGDKAYIEKFVGVSRGVAIAPRPGKKKQKIASPRQSTLLDSRPQQQQLSPPHLNRAAASRTPFAS